MRRSFSSRTGRVALCGILAAASLVILYLACMAPSGRMGLTAVAGLFPVGAVLAAGRAAGYLCWGAASLLGLLMLPDKGVALMFLVFLGLYPVVKSRIEGLGKQWQEWPCKLLYFNGALMLFWFVLRGLFLPTVPQFLAGRTWLLFLLGNAIFMAYDLALSRLIGGLVRRGSARGRHTNG